MRQSGTMGAFQHHSEQAHENMLWKYRTAWTRLNRGGVLLAHDSGSSNAISDFGRMSKAEGLNGESLGGL
jgi:hypothetical protein